MKRDVKYCWVVHMLLSYWIVYIINCTRNWAAFRSVAAADENIALLPLLCLDALPTRHKAGSAGRMTLCDVRNMTLKPCTPPTFPQFKNKPERRRNSIGRISCLFGSNALLLLPFIVCRSPECLVNSSLCLRPERHKSRTQSEVTGAASCRPSGMQKQQQRLPFVLLSFFASLICLLKLQVYVHHIIQLKVTALSLRKQLLRI